MFLDYFDEDLQLGLIGGLGDLLHVLEGELFGAEGGDDIGDEIEGDEDEGRVAFGVFVDYLQGEEDPVFSGSAVGKDLLVVVG